MAAGVVSDSEAGKWVRCGPRPDRTDMAMIAARPRVDESEARTPFSPSVAPVSDGPSFFAVGDFGGDAGTDRPQLLSTGAFCVRHRFDSNERPSDLAPIAITPRRRRRSALSRFYEKNVRQDLSATKIFGTFEINIRSGRSLRSQPFSRQRTFLVFREQHLQKLIIGRFGKYQLVK